MLPGVLLGYCLVARGDVGHSQGQRASALAPLQ